MKSLALPAAAVLVLAGCGQKPAVAPVSSRTHQTACTAMTLEFLGSGVIGAETMIDGARVGGLSGIDYDNRENRFVLISDDRGANGGARLFSAEINSQSDQFLAITLHSVRPLRTDRNGPRASVVPAMGVDSEAVRILPSRLLLWASEGDAATGAPPGIYISTRNQSVGQALRLPAELQPDKTNSKGPRQNRSFEGLTHEPYGSTFFIALEAPLLGQGELPTIANGAVTPIYRLGFNGKIWARFAYPLEPIARQLDGLLADNGISEIVALGPKQFLVLERSGSQQQDGSFRFVTRLFCAWSATAGQPTRLQKQLVADFNHLGPFDSANFEGMTFGPPLPDGRRTLLLVADNDFRSDRPSLLAKFAVNDQPKRD